MELYNTVDGQFNVKLEDLQVFMQRYPDAQKVDSEKTTISSSKPEVIGVEIVEGKGMFAGETELPSGFGKLAKKVKNTKDFVKDIFSTQDSVKENDEKVTSTAAE